MLGDGDGAGGGDAEGRRIEGLEREDGGGDGDGARAGGVEAQMSLACGSSAAGRPV